MRKATLIIISIIMLVALSCSIPEEGSVGYKTAKSIESKLRTNGWSISESAKLTVNGKSIKYTQNYMDYYKKSVNYKYNSKEFDKLKTLDTSYISIDDLVGHTAEVYKIDFSLPQSVFIECASALFWVDSDSGIILTGGIYLKQTNNVNYIILRLDARYSEASYYL